MFTPSNMLLNYLNTTPRDMYDIIGALMGYINADPAFKTDDFDQAVQYVLDHGVSKDELFAEFDLELDFEEDSSKWDEEYYSLARVYLKDNFSEKRIKHIKEVARKLNPNVVIVTKRNIQEPVQKDEGVSASKGGFQSTGKKSQGQQQLNRRNELPTTSEHRSAKTPVLIVIVVLVLLALLIAVIILLGKSKTDPQSAAVSGSLNYKNSITETQNIAEIMEQTVQIA